MRSEWQTLRLERHDSHVLCVTLDRPRFANAIDTRMGRELGELWSSLYVDAEDVRCVVLTGAGRRAFCAGGDLKEREGMTDEAWQRQHAVFEQAWRAHSECPIPVIAAVNGAAYAGGCELALACDFVYAARSARFALTEVTLGIMPGAMGTQNLPRAVGLRRAKEIVLTGRPFGAEEALRWGLVNAVFDDEALLDAALDTARAVSANAPIAVRQAKKALDMATQVDLRTGFAFELEAYNRMVPTQDRIEGVRAFNEKRRPRFTGQ